MRSIILVSGVLALCSQAVQGGDGAASDFDYCSIGHSLEVYEDAANIFDEVFGGYAVPMDAAMCPFHYNNLSYLREK